MAKLSLSEVSQRFNISRSTLYRSIKEGRLSRSPDGLFDIAEVVRCFGEPEIKSKSLPQEPIKKDDADLRQLVDFMKKEIEAYKDREQRYLDQIDRFQLLLGHKGNQEGLSHETTMRQTNETPRDKPQTHNETPINIDIGNKNKSHETPITHTNDAPRDKSMTHSETSSQKSKKRGLFSRVLDAVLSDD